MYFSMFIYFGIMCLLRIASITADLECQMISEKNGAADENSPDDTNATEASEIADGNSLLERLSKNGFEFPSSLTLLQLTVRL